MAPNADIIRFSPTPTFTARMLALPALNEAVNRALDVFDSTKVRNDGLGAALRAAEASMRVAASGALPLATPIVNTVGGWSVVDEWACRGLDKVEEVAPIIKKPTQEIVTTTRQTLASLSEAITTRANNTADSVVNSRGGQAVMNAADQMLISAHIMVDNYLPEQGGDKQGKGKKRLLIGLIQTKRHDQLKQKGSESQSVPTGGVTIKITSLYNKLQQRLYRSVYIIIRPPSETSTDGTITIAMLIEFSRRTATDVFEEISREPRQGEEQSATMALTRASVKLTKQYTEQLRAIIQKQLDSMSTMNREDFTQFLQNVMKSGIDMTSNVGVFVAGGANSIVNFVGHLMVNASAYGIYIQDMIRKARSDYDQRERTERATAAASTWRKKNQMERVASPPQSPPPEESTVSTGTVNKSKKKLGRL